MNKIWIIIQREYISRVKKKSFLITTLLAPLGFLLLTAASVMISSYSQEKLDIAVVDETGFFKDVPIADAEDGSVYFHKVELGYDTLVQQLSREKELEYQAIIFIPADFNFSSTSNAKLQGKYLKRIGLTKRQAINQKMSDAVQKVRMKMLHINEDQIGAMQQKTDVSFTSLNNKSEMQGYTDAAAVVGIAMGFAIYISLFFYGTLIMKGVMEEKTNRIVEVLTSSVKPFQLLMGKIVGIGAVGLTQFILWIILMALIYVFALPFLAVYLGTHGSHLPQGNDPKVDPDSVLFLVNNIRQLPLTQIAVLFPIYFVGGFLLYGSLFAAVGSAIGEDGDQQSLMLPIMVPIIISILIAVNVINNPDSSLGFWGSIIPFTSPVVMCALLPFRPGWLQITVSIIMLAGGFIFTTWVAARIYRVGILMYGKKVKLKEVARWIFSKT